MRFIHALFLAAFFGSTVACAGQVDEVDDDEVLVDDFGVDPELEEESRNNRQTCQQRRDRQRVWCDTRENFCRSSCGYRFGSGDNNRNNRCISACRAQVRVCVNRVTC
jgi:hypothetical protein